MKKKNFSAMKRQELEQYAAATTNEVEELKLRIQYYEEQLRLHKVKQYGPKADQVDSDQLSLFNDAELDADPQAAEPEMAKVKPQAPKKSKKKGARQKMLSSLPKTVVEYRLSADQQNCPVCGEPLHEMNKQIRRTLEIIPAQVRVLEEISYVYSCRNCERNAVNTPVITAPHPSAVLPKSVLSPSLAAFILTRKFENRDPLYKISQDFERQGLKISRQTLSNWVVKLSECYGSHLYERMKQHLLSMEILHADETPLQVLNEPGRTAAQKSYMWLYRSGRTDVPIVLFEYADNRSGETPKAFLAGFRGYLQTDGYAGYLKVDSGVTHVGCWAHLRRKFVEALKALPKTAQAQEAATAEKKGIQFCGELFHLDQQVKELPPEKRLAYKEKNICSKMEEFFQWAEELQPKALPRSKLGEALTYAVNQKEYLMNYLQDGRLELSNNPAERSIRPFVIGRKNWLFCNTPAGAQASAILYSLMITAKENGLKPFEYFTVLFDRMRDIAPTDTERLDELLPWSTTLPDSCRVPSQDQTDDSTRPL